MAGRGQSKRVMASTAKKQMGRRQAGPGKANATTHGAQTSNGTVMDLLLDLVSHISASEELLATLKETESKYPPARSVRDHTGNVQPEWQPNNLALCTEGQPPEVAQEICQQVARHLKRAPKLPRCYSEDDAGSEEEQVPPKKRRIAIKSGKVRTVSRHHSTKTDRVAA